MLITYIIIALSVAASFYAWQNPDVYRKWMMNPYSVARNGEYYRFITSGFIHADQMHLVVNMFSFFFFGTAMEQAFFYPRFGGVIGAILFVGFYLLGIIVSEIPTYLKHKKDSWYNSLGASGAVSAVVYGSILLWPTRNLYLFFAIPIPAILFGIGYLYYTYRAAKMSQGNINHDAHLYGALFGLLFIIIIFPEAVPSFFSQLVIWVSDKLGTLF